MNRRCRCQVQLIMRLIKGIGLTQAKQDACHFRKLTVSSAVLSDINRFVECGLKVVI